MSALQEYLDEFFRDSLNIADFKIDFLKNHYYDRINNIISIDRQDFLIGTETKLPIEIRKRFLFFKSRKNTIFEIVYDIENNKYAVRYKNNPKFYNIATLHMHKYNNIAINNHEINNDEINKDEIYNNYIEETENYSCRKSCRFKLKNRSCCII